MEEFLKSAQRLAEREEGTLTWYAVKIAPAKYAIFDTFATEGGRDAHLTKEIAKARELFAKDPEILEVLAAKAHLTGSKPRGAHN